MSIQKEAMKWVIGNKGLKVNDFNYKSPRVSSEYIDCSMPMTFDSMNYCGMGCTYCTDGKTPVYGKNLPRGKQQIAKLKVGDGVWSFNEVTQQVEEDIVTSVMARTANEYYEIDTEDGHTIKITGEHPVFVVGKGWTEVQHLSVGDEVVRIHPYISPGAKNLITYNTSDAGRKKVQENCQLRNPMKRAPVAKKQGATLRERWANDELAHTPEHTAKIAAAAKQRMDSTRNPMKQEGMGSKVRRKVVENGNCSQGEALLITILNERAVNYISQYRYTDKRRARGEYVVDVLLPERNIALEYDEHTRHFTPEGTQFDIDRDAYLLSEYGVTVHRFRNRGCALSKPRMIKFLQQVGVI